MASKKISNLLPEFHTSTQNWQLQRRGVEDASSGDVANVVLLRPNRGNFSLFASGNSLFEGISLD